MPSKLICDCNLPGCETCRQRKHAQEKRDQWAADLAIQTAILQRQEPAACSGTLQQSSPNKLAELVDKILDGRVVYAGRMI